MKINTIQTCNESIQIAHNEDWYDSLIMWIESLRQKPKSEINSDTNQNNLNRIIHDTIHQDMNRIKIARHVTEVSSERFKVIWIESKC